MKIAFVGKGGSGKTTPIEITVIAIWAAPSSRWRGIPMADCS